jgi:1-acyl-sn-glycerol-3-phosphate acyltransferase
LRRSTLRVIARFLFRLLGRVCLSGFEDIPLGSTYITAINHVSIYDPPLAVTFWPEHLEVIGAADVFAKPVQGQIISVWGTTPVHRGEYDRALLDATLALLRRGRPLLMAPEGGRSHVPAMRRAKPGIAYIVDEVPVPIVPVGVVGAGDHFLRDALLGKRQTLEVRVGKPFMLPPLTGRGGSLREARQRNADLVMQHIASLLPPEYGGVYAAPRPLRPA